MFYNTLLKTLARNVSQNWWQNKRHCTHLFVNVQIMFFHTQMKPVYMYVLQNPDEIQLQTTSL